MSYIGPNASEAAYPPDAARTEGFMTFLKDKVDLLSGMRQNYDPSMALIIVSSSALLLAAELVYPMPDERDARLNRARGKSVRTAVEKSMAKWEETDASIDLSALKLIELEAVDPRLPRLIEVLQSMHDIGMEEDVFETSAQAVFELAEDENFLPIV